MLTATVSAIESVEFLRDWRGFKKHETAALPGGRAVEWARRGIVRVVTEGDRPADHPQDRQPAAPALPPVNRTMKASKIKRKNPNGS